MSGLSIFLGNPNLLSKQKIFAKMYDPTSHKNDRHMEYYLSIIFNTIQKKLEM